MAQNPYNTDLDRNPANFQPLTPLTFLERMNGERFSGATDDPKGDVTHTGHLILAPRHCRP